jgi:hypothetical protein
MRAKEYLGWYAKSPLCIGSLAAGLVLGIGLAAAGLPAAAPIASALGLVALCGLFGLFSGIGPRQVISAMDAGRASEGRKRLEGTAAAREKLGTLRLADPQVAEAAGLVALAAGEYIEACRRESADDPLADAAAAEALDVLDIYLKEADEASVEKRYKLEDADPFAQARERTVTALREKAATLRERRIQVDGGLSAAARMEIREELK